MKNGETREQTIERERKKVRGEEGRKGERNRNGREMKTKRTQPPGQQWRIDPPKLALMRRNACVASAQTEQHIPTSLFYSPYRGYFVNPIDLPMEKINRDKSSLQTGEILRRTERGEKKQTSIRLMRKSMRSEAVANDRLLTNVVASLRLNSFQTRRFCFFIFLLSFIRLVQTVIA